MTDQTDQRDDLAPETPPADAPTAGPADAPTAGPTDAPTAGPDDAPQSTSVPAAQPVQGAVADVGVDMLPGHGDEPQGPEDAAGFGPKRGDYRDRVSAGTTVIPNPRYGEEGEPRTIIVDQQALAGDIADEPGVKGGTQPAPQ
jgi:hypothetical protein